MGAEPCRELRPFVSEYWAGESSEEKRDLGAIFANRDIHVSFDFVGRHYQHFGGRAHEIPRARIVGANRERYLFHREGQWDSFHITFRPGCGACFLRIPSNQLTGQSLDLAEAWGSEAALLWEQLAEVGSLAQRVRVAERELLRRLPDIEPPHPAVAQTMRLLDAADESVSVELAAEHVRLTTRQLQRAYNRWVGYGPKTFARVSRFQRGLEAISGRPTCSLAHVAVSLGYFDEAHMIHDFREFAGATPLSLLRTQ